MNKDLVHKITLCQLNPRSGGLSVVELNDLIKVSGLKRTRKNNYLRTKFDKCLTLTLNNVSDYISTLKKSNIYNLVNSIEKGDYDDFIDSNIKKFQREEVNNLKKQLSDNADKIKDEERKIKHTMKKLSKKLNEKNNNTDVVDRVNLISKSKSKKMSNIKAKQSEYLDEMNKLNYSKNKLSKKENQLERSIILIEEQKNVINELKNRLDSVKETDIKLINQLEGFKSSENLLLEKINELREVEKSLKKEIKYLQEDMNKKQSSNEENRTETSMNQINNLKSQLTKIKELNTELTDANQKLKEDISSREKEVNSLEKKDFKNDKEKSKLKEKADEYEIIIEEKKSLEKQLQKSLNIQNNMNQRIQKLEVVKQRNTENLQELDELNKLLASNDKKEDKKNKELSKNKENIFNLQRKLNYQNEELQKLYGQNQDIANQTKRFTNLIKEKDRQVEKIKEELDARDDTLEQLQDRVRNMKLESASKDYNIDSLKKDVSENEKEIENMKYKNDLLIKEVDSIKSEYEKISLENKKLENDIKLLLGDVKEYQNLVGDLKDAKVYVESRKSLEKDLEDLQSNLSSSNEFIGNMENEIDKLIDDSSLLKRKYMNEELNKLDNKQSREYFKKKVSNLVDQYDKYRKQISDHEIDKQKYTDKLSKYDNEISDLLSNADIIVGNVGSNVKIGKMREYITNSKKIQEQMKLVEVNKNENNKKLRSILEKMSKISNLLDDIREVDAKEKNLERLSELSSKMQVLEENFMKNEEDVDVASMFQKVLSDEKEQGTSCKNITNKDECKPPCSYIWLDDLRACVTKTAESQKLSNAIRLKILQRKKQQQGGSNIDEDNDLLVQKVSSLQDEIIMKTKDLSERRKLYLEEIERLRKESNKQKSDNDLSIKKFEKQNEIDKNKLSTLEADKLKLQSQLDESAKKIDSINAEIADINFTESGSVSIKQEEKKGFFGNLFGKKDKLNKSKLRELVRKLVKLEDENKNMKEKLETRLSQKSQLSSNLNKINEVMDSENNTPENMKTMKNQQKMGREQIQRLEIETSSLQKDFQRSQNDINSVMKDINSMNISSSQLNELRELVDSKENFYSVLGDDSNEGNDSEDIGKQNTSTKISKLVARVKILEKQKDELENKLDTKNKEANQLESNVENAKTFITESKTKEIMQTTSLEELQRMLKQKEEENIALTNNINQLQEKLGESSGDKTEIRDLGDKAKNNKELAEKYQKNIEDLNAKILGMTETNMKKGSKQELELEKMNLQLKEFTNKQKEAQSQADEYMKKLEESTEKLNKRNEEISNLQNELKELEKSSEESDDELKKQLEEKYNSIISDKEAKIKQNIDDFESKEKELELKIKERETEINEKNKKEIEQLKEESKKSNEKLKGDIKGMEEKAQKDIQKEKEEFERKKEEIMKKQKEIQENANKEVEKAKSERNDDKKKQTEMIADTQRKLEADKKNEIDKLNQKMEEEKRNLERKILEIEGGNKDEIEKERQRSEKIQKDSEEKIRRSETEATQKINELNQKYQNQQQQLKGEVENAKQASMGQLEQLKNQHQMQLQQITSQKDMEIQRLNQQVQGTIGMVQQAQREAQTQAMGQAQIIQDQYKASEERLKNQQLDSEKTRTEETFKLQQDFNAREAKLEQEQTIKDNERNMVMEKMKGEHNAQQEALKKDQEEITKKMNEIDDKIKQKSERTREITEAIDNQIETRDIIEGKVKARLEKENEYDMKLLKQQKDKLEKDKADLKANIESLKLANEQDRINLEKEYKEEREKYKARYDKLEAQSKKQENLCGNRKINSLDDLVKSYKECGSRIKSIEMAVQSRIREMEKDMSSFGEVKDVQEFNKEDLKPDELLNLLKTQMEKEGADVSTLSGLDDYSKFRKEQTGEDKVKANAEENIKKLIKIENEINEKQQEIENTKKVITEKNIEESKQHEKIKIQIDEKGVITGDTNNQELKRIIEEYKNGLKDYEKTPEPPVKPTGSQRDIDDTDSFLTKLDNALGDLSKINHNSSFNNNPFNSNKGAMKDKIQKYDIINNATEKSIKIKSILEEKTFTKNIDELKEKMKIKVNNDNDFQTIINEILEFKKIVESLRTELNEKRDELIDKYDKDVRDYDRKLRKYTNFDSDKKNYIDSYQRKFDVEIDKINNKQILNNESKLNKDIENQTRTFREIILKLIDDKNKIIDKYPIQNTSDSSPPSVSEKTQQTDALAAGVPTGSQADVATGVATGVTKGGGRTAGDRIDDLLNKFQNTYKRYQSHVNDVVDDSRKGEEIVERIQQYAESSANQIKYLTNLNLTHQMADRNIVLYMLGRRQDKNNNVKYVNEYNILLQTAQKEKALNELNTYKKGEENAVKKAWSNIKEVFKNKIDAFDLSGIIGDDKNNVNIATYDDETGEDVPLGNDNEEQANLNILEKLESQINSIMKTITTEDVRSAIDYLADRRVDELNSEQFAQLVIKMNKIEKEKDQLNKDKESWNNFREILSEEAGTDDVDAIIEVYKDVKKKLTEKNSQLQNRADELSFTLKHISEKVKNDSNLLRNMRQDLGSQLEYMAKLEQEGLNKNKNVEEAMEHQQVSIEQIKNRLNKRINELRESLAISANKSNQQGQATGGSNPLGLIQTLSKKLYKSNKNYGKYLVNLMRKNITRHDVNKSVNLYNKYVNKGNFLKKEYSSQQAEYHNIINNVLEVQDNPHIYFVGGSLANRDNNKNNKNNSVSKSLSLLLSRLNSSADRFLNSLEKKNTSSNNTENTKYAKYFSSYNKLNKEMKKNKDTSKLKYYQSRLQKIQNKLMKYSEKNESKGGSKVPKAFNPQNLDQFVSQWQDNTNSSWQQYLNEPKVVENMTLGKVNHINKASLSGKELDTSNFSVNFT